MSTALADDSIVFAAPRVIARPESAGVLLFHVVSDEIYYVSRAGFELFARCRGGPRVKDLEAFAGRGDVRPYLQQLLDRGLIVVWDEATP